MLIIQLTPEQLKACIKEAVEEAVQKSGHLREIPPNGAGPPKELMDIKELCREFGWARPTVYSWTSKGIIPHIRKGKKLMFYRKEILAWLETGRVKTKAEIRENISRFYKGRP